MMEYVRLMEDSHEITVCFYMDHDKVTSIGEKMNEIHEDAYMNGYNWEVFFQSYLEQNEPDVLKEMDTDPESDLYSAVYDYTEENKLRADKFVAIIHSLMENEEQVYQFIREQGSKIDWD